MPTFTKIIAIACLSVGHAQDENCLLQAGVETVVRGPKIPLNQVTGTSVFLKGKLTGLTEQDTGFSLRRIHDHTRRSFRVSPLTEADVNGPDPQRAPMYESRSAKDTFRGRTVLYEAGSEMPLALIRMANHDAAMRMSKDYAGGLPDIVDRNLGITYNVFSYKQVCAGQHPVGKDKDGNGVGEADIYDFAKVTKNSVLDRWVVRRMQCDQADGTSNSRWAVAYNLARHGLASGLDATSPKVGVVGTIDSIREAGNNHRQEAWLAKGEDPALFTAALMVTEFPTDVRPDLTDYQAERAPVKTGPIRLAREAAHAVGGAARMSNDMLGPLVSKLPSFVAGKVKMMKDSKEVEVIGNLINRVK